LYRHAVQIHLAIDVVRDQDARVRLPRASIGARLDADAKHRVSRRRTPRVRVDRHRARVERIAIRVRETTLDRPVIHLRTTRERKSTTVSRRSASISISSRRDREKQTKPVVSRVTSHL